MVSREDVSPPERAAAPPVRSAGDRPIGLGPVRPVTTIPEDAPAGPRAHDHGSPTPGSGSNGRPGRTGRPRSEDTTTVQGGAAVQVGLVVAAVGGLWIGARLLVDSVVRLARRVGLSELTIGLTIVAAGTSTPELVVTIGAALDGLGGIAVGNVVGSNVFNVLGVLGVAAAIRPLSVGGAALETIAWLTVISVVMVAALWTGRKLSRAEGGLFAASEILRWVLGLLGLGPGP